ncbi:MAG: hypothetical protein FJ096_10400 [Deltaproteobacteria bacterium]|nr:hypothetical protein [Deltaproteobacteria bacterium]
MSRLPGRIASVLALAVAGIQLGACTPPRADASGAHLAAMRAHAVHGSGELSGEWLLAELLEPGGSQEGVKAARDRVATGEAKGLLGSLARALDADVHGKLPTAADAYLDVLEAARQSPRIEAPMFAWFAASRAEALRSVSAGFEGRAAPLVARITSSPGNVGWRARSLLVEWGAREAYRSKAQLDSADLLTKLAIDQGCIGAARFAGPFGRRQPGDHRRHHAAERPGPWPLRFEPEVQGESRRAESFDATARGCALRAHEPHGEGIHYVQTFLDVDAPRDVILAVSGAFSVRVDDVEVLTRDEADWGSWPRLGVRLSLAAGRHRVVARLARPETTIRVLTPTGLPAPVRVTADERAPYQLEPPVVLADPNPLEPYLRALGVKGSAPAGEPPAPVPAYRAVAAALAATEGHRDLADVLLLPLVEGDKATPVALAQAAQLVEGDPIFTPETGRSMARDLHTRASERDPGLWASRLWLALDRAAQARPADTARELERLSEEFPDVPTVAGQLAAIEAKLGWTVEEARTVKRLVERFPDDVPTLEAALAVAERQGQLAEVDRLARRISLLDPLNELAFRRALRREDYDAALAELRRIEAHRSDRADLPVRIAELLERAGRTDAGARAVVDKLELSLAAAPRDPALRLALADARNARGERGALDDALVDAIRAGADTRTLRQAIELVDGATALEPYRKDGLAILREAEAKGITLPGAAARILDYAALWVAADGSARMLEHTVLRVQSREGIARHTEQRIPPGVILKLRTIKKDGRILEPETVQGKPTVTMPHLEIGDAIETESIWMMSGDGEGRRFRSPRWFFREPNVSYHLSQFVVIAPKSRPFSIETSGRVPPPELTTSEGLEVRKWTVAGALALPEEPGAPPIEEFLPSVLMGWGADWYSQLERLSEARGGGQPADPRLLRIAQTIATGKLDGKLDEVPDDLRAQRIYRWVVDNVAPGEERWPPRIVTSKSGDLTEAFLYLCRLAGVDARLGVVKSRLAPPSRGALSDLEAFASTAVRVKTELGARWLLVGSRFAPYGFLPSSLAGQPAILVDAPGPETGPLPGPLLRERTTTGGIEDGVLHRGTVKLDPSGSARLELTEEFRGRYAIAIRTALSQVEAVGAAENERRRVLVEQRMIGPKLPGARVERLTLHNLDALDEPLRMTVSVEVPNFARRDGAGLVFDAPFLGSMGPLVALGRRETPLYVEDSARSRIDLSIELPPSARLTSALETTTLADPRVRVEVKDALKGQTLRLEREVVLPAGRVLPEDYAEFREIVRRADGLLNQPIRLTL